MWLRIRPLELILVLFTCLCIVSAKISDKRLCADPKCSVPISEGVTSLKYSSPWRDQLSFGQNADVKVYSKSAGSDPSLWGVEIKGKRGYAPQRMIRENRKLFTGELQYEVSTTEDELAAATEEVKSEEVPQSIKNRVEDEQMTDGQATTTNDTTTTGGESGTVNDSPEEVANIEEKLELPVELNSKEQVQVEEPKVEELVASSFSLNDDVVLEKIPSADKIHIPAPVEEAEEGSKKADELTAENFASKQNEAAIPVPASLSEEDQKVVDNIQQQIDAAMEADDEEEEDYEDDDEEEDEDGGEAGEDSGVESDDNKEVVEEEKKEEVVEDTPKASPEENSETGQIPPAIDQVPEVTQPQVLSDSSAQPVETINDLPDVQPEVKVEELPPKDDLPTPPSLLLGDFINLNSGEAPPMVTSPPPTAMQFDETENGIEDLENSTNSGPGNDTAPIQEVPEVTEKPIDVPVVEDIQNEIPNGGKEDKLVDPIPPPVVEPPKVMEYLPPVDNVPFQEREQLMENRIPPIVQEHMANDFHSHGHFHDHHDHGHHGHDHHHHHDNHNNDFHGQPPPPPPLTDSNYQPPPPPPVNQDYIYPPPAEIPSYPPSPPTPPVYEEPSQEIPTTQSSMEMEEIVPTEIPSSIGDQEDVTTNSPPIGQVEQVQRGEEKNVENVKEEQEEEVETGPSFVENLISKTKEFLGSIDFASMFKSKEEVPANTEQNGVIIGDHVEGVVDEEFCEKVSPDSCPGAGKAPPPPSAHSQGFHHPMVSHRDRPEEVKIDSPSTPIDYSAYVVKFLDLVLSMTDLIICLTIVAITLLVFVFMHLCFSRSQRENHFVAKLNALERELMNRQKQVQLLDAELAETKHKLCSIEDNSFGTNDMVMALRGELEEQEAQKQELLVQVAGLEKELETAAEAGLELNRMVSELLSNQQGSDTIISSVEGLQAQLNEQQETIHAINTLLAEKSRENSELLVELGELRARCEEEESGQSERVVELEQEVQKVTEEKEELEKEFVKKEKELEKIKTSLLRDLERKLDDANGKSLRAEARAEALEESLKVVEGKNGVDKADMSKLLSVARVKTNLLTAVKERDQMAEKLEGETRSKALLEEQIGTINAEVQRLRTEYNQMEKEKLEANTKLGILSNYFKEKETQLQKELSVKEAQCMQQQGETTSTVEKIRSMQEEIQSLKSQNESLKNEVEVQEATHKTQILSLENRAHESWLATRQTERRLEESRSEAAVLRRKLTAMSAQGGDGSVDAAQLVNGSASSPLHMDGVSGGVGAGPGSPIMPPLPGFMPPPPFMPAPMPPHGFMPPPPFEMRPPPLGRLMSPPPPGVNPGTRYSPHLMDRGGRYTPDSRYDHFSPYETETDISPPGSPVPFRSRHSSGGSGNYNNSGGGPGRGPSNPKKFGHNNSKGHRNNYSDRSDEFV